MAESALTVIAKALWKAENDTGVEDPLNLHLIEAERHLYDTPAQEVIDGLERAGATLVRTASNETAMLDALSVAARIDPSRVSEVVMARMLELYTSLVRFGAKEAEANPTHQLRAVLAASAPRSELRNMVERLGLENVGQFITNEIAARDFVLVPLVPTEQTIAAVMAERVRPGSPLALLLGEDQVNIRAICRQLIIHERSH